MYQKHYQFKNRPFTVVPNPGCLFMSSKHKLAFAHLQYGRMEGTGFVVLTGGIGTGKTTLLRFLLGKIERAMDVAVVFNTNVSGAELLRLIIREFEAGEPGEDKAANLAMLNDFLIERFRQGRHAILIIDEAQNLSLDALEEVRLLSNLQGSQRPLLQVILAGQPELRRKLADPNLTQLAQRIISTFHLAPLDQGETGQYIRYRLTQAGGNPELFDGLAINAVHRASGGVPRVINILCNNALVHGFADHLPVITADVVEGVVAETGSMFRPTASEEEAPRADRTAQPELAGRVRAMEDRLTAMNEKIAAGNAETQLMLLEITALKDRLNAVESAPPAPVDEGQESVLPLQPKPDAAIPETARPFESDPSWPDGRREIAKKGVLARFRELVFGV
jgi:general secretion pathway protein A